jgi:hypothetical protein
MAASGHLKPKGNGEWSKSGSTASKHTRQGLVTGRLRELLADQVALPEEPDWRASMNMIVSTRQILGKQEPSATYIELFEEGLASEPTPEEKKTPGEAQRLHGRAQRPLQPWPKLCAIGDALKNFMRRAESIKAAMDSGLDIISHNLETVERLTPLVRSGSFYDRSLWFLALSKEFGGRLLTKSSLMLGPGEGFAEILKAMDDLRACPAQGDCASKGVPALRGRPAGPFFLPRQGAARRPEAQDRGPWTGSGSSTR